MKDNFTAYEYKNITVKRAATTIYEDCLANFGWTLVDEHEHGMNPSGINYAPVNTPTPRTEDTAMVSMKFKRDRNINNKLELNRLERQCEAALASMDKVESKGNAYTMGVSLGTGIIGTVLLGFAIYGFRSANMVLGVIMLILGVVGWAVGFFANRKVSKTKATQTEPMIQEQMDIAYHACEQAHTLLA